MPSEALTFFARARSMQPLRWALACLFVCFGLLACGAGESGYEGDESTTEEALSLKVARFPSRKSIEYAFRKYLSNAADARARSAVSLDEFFGKKLSSSNQNTLRVEILKPEPGDAEQPIAFLAAQFHGTDMYWNNRYKDMQLFRLADSTGTPFNPFPEAQHVARDGAALIRMWTDFRPIKDGAPPGLDGKALSRELARMNIWSYVGGNVDGPVTNANNGGFAKFLDKSGKEQWKGVLIDEGAAWNMPSAEHLPWNSNLLGKGPVQAEDIPDDVKDSLVQIARDSAESLAKRSAFDSVDEGAKSIVRGIRERARQVLEHYGIKWQ